MWGKKKRASGCVREKKTDRKGKDGRGNSQCTVITKETSGGEVR